MRLDELLRIARSPSIRVVSTDVFDTLLLRDASRQRHRFAEAAVAAAQAVGADPRSLAALRIGLHRDAYRAVAAENGAGEARLTRICEVAAQALGLNHSLVGPMHDAEVETDLRHLSPNHDLMETLRAISSLGKRVVAVSDTYYDARDLEAMLRGSFGSHPIAKVYASCDLNQTKHNGGLFAAVASSEGVEGGQILHVGDDPRSDVAMARAAGWASFHLKRDTRALACRKIGVELLSAVGAMLPTARKGDRR